MRLAIGLLGVFCVVVPRVAESADWYAATDGRADGAGTKRSPWDLQSALAGAHEIYPGDTLWVLPGTYKYPDRKTGGVGYTVRLAGRPDQPVYVRGVPGQRVTIDGGLNVQPPSTYLWIRDLEILVSEPRPPKPIPPDSSYRNVNRPWGGLNVYSGTGCKYINLVIHDNSQGVSFWSEATGGELYGCVIYDNGWAGTDRGHGHAIYTQNQHGTKTIAECIMTGGFGYTMHAYGSSRAYVDNYLAEGNVCYDAGQFLIGGGRPSHNIRVLNNYLYNVDMRLGYDAPQNEDCKLHGNVIVDGRLEINKFQTVEQDGNTVLAKNDPRPSDSPARIEIRPNRYDADRFHVIVFNWAKASEVPLQLDGHLKPGDRFRLMDPRDLFGKPVLSGTFDGKPIAVPLKGEFAAFVLLRSSR